MPRHPFIAAILAAVLLFLPSCRESTSYKELPPPAVGSSAPPFALKDLNGRNVSLRDFSGKIVVIDFWATWCLPCRETTQEMNRLSSSFRDKGVVFIGISMDGGGSAAAKVKDFARKYHLTYTMLIDDGTASKAYYVNKIPTTYILDKEHTIVKMYPGYLPGLGRMISKEIESRL